ncbi:MAG: hypothetical protein GX822_04275 [Alcaligenaceae bacterium]|jgi:hypothetical protein|nr:hypothetical protein [Alcaligenaceae bacterium]
MGYGNDIDRQERTTASGINTENLLITDPDTQLLLTGLGHDAMAERVFTNTTTETAAADSGALVNRFDADVVQRELDVQVAVWIGLRVNLCSFQLKSFNRELRCIICVKIRRSLKKMPKE